MHAVSKSCPSFQPFLRITPLPAAHGRPCICQCSCGWTAPHGLSCPRSQLYWLPLLLQDSPGPAHSVLFNSTRPIRHASIPYGYARHLSIPFLSFEIFQLVSPLLPSLYLQVEGSFYPSRYSSEVSVRRGDKPKHSFFVFGLDKGQNSGPTRSTDSPAFPLCLQQALSRRQGNSLHFWKSQSPPYGTGITLPPTSLVAVRIK